MGLSVKWIDMKIYEDKNMSKWISGLVFGVALGFSMYPFFILNIKDVKTLDIAVFLLIAAAISYFIIRIGKIKPNN